MRKSFERFEGGSVSTSDRSQGIDLCQFPYCLSLNDDTRRAYT